MTGAYNQNEIKYLIGRCDFFIGARMHACIAALSQCIPTVSIAYSDKFIGVMKSIGMESYCVDPRTQETGEITACLNDALAAQAETRALLRQTIPRVRQTVLGLFGPRANPLKERSHHESDQIRRPRHPAGRPLPAERRP